MKKRIIIVHGWGGSPTSDWIGWAAQAFQDKGYEVITPLMPDTDNPVIEKWVGHLASTVGEADETTYFIGHSVGCQAVMRYLETIDIKVGGAVFVAGWFDLTNQDEEEKAIAEPWIQTPIDFGKVRKNLSKSVVMLSNNDPYVPYEATKRDFEIRLGSEVVTIPDAGHIDSDAGFNIFPQLVEIFESHF
jgi:predicted alpha/beta hydrolase family esterase